MDKMAAHPEQIVFRAGPNDGGGLCQCDDCMAMRTEGYREPSSNRLTTSSLVFGFGNELAKITSKKYPDRYLGIYVYSDYSQPPKKLDTLHPNVFPMIAWIRRCRIHGPGVQNLRGISSWSGRSRTG